MGVPAFYRWLSTRYPKIVKPVIDEEPAEVDGQEVPVDLMQPCQNGEWDNLYLDMNGIIHPCFHPEDREEPTTEEEVFQLIFEYIDHVFSLIRPRRLLFMAIDGVAPRAKMNQQRSRRFKSMKEAEEKRKEEEKLRDEFSDMGMKVPHKKEKGGQLFDSNVITPGTAFMARLSIALQYYVRLRQNTLPAWKDLMVILSDANTPGEGEHKIVSYIREQRDRKGWDPNTRHVLYGLDADLIMLALATHEPHFAILREVINFNQKDGTKDSSVAALSTASPAKKANIAKKPYQLLFVHILRAYLALELHQDGLPFEWDEERVFDDFVFLCFFVGNDFLPHSPTLEIREGGIDLLMRRYRKILPQLGGYLCEGSKVNLKRVEMLVQEVSKEEEDILRSRMKRQKDQRENKERQRKRHQEERSKKSGTGQGSNSTSTNHEDLWKTMESVRMQRQDGSQDSSDVSSSNPPLTNHEDIWKTMESIGKKDDKNPFKLPAETVSGEASAEKAAKLQKEFESKINGIMKEKGDKFDEMMEHDANMALGEEGYKDRYYKSKFPHHKNLQEVKDGMVTAYVEGLCWVMGYYYDGVPSWRWFYPYHYAPFTSDLCQMSHIQPCFELAKPFDPIQQLMSVLPAGSRHSLPEPLQHLFISKDSPIKDFYPSDFEQDMNGKRYLWQAVALLPFIDEDRLVKAMEPHMSKLTPEEKERNTTKPHQLYLHSAHSLAPAVREMACTMKGVPGKQRFQSKVAINPGDAKGMSGFIGLPAGDHCPSVVQAPFKLGKDIMANRVLRIVYFYPPHKMHQARLLEGAYLPECSVDVGDIPPENPLWHEKDRMRRQGRPHDAPFLGDAARRHIHHNLDRGPFRQSAPSPTNIPSGVTEAALRAANSKPLNPQAPPFPPENVTQLAIRMSRQQQLQGYAEQVSNGQSPPLAQFQTGLWLAGGANVGHSGQIPEMMTGAGPAANTGIPQGTYWDGSQLVNRLYAFGQQSYGQQAEGQQPFGLQGCSASFMDEGAGMNGYVDNNGAVAGYHQSKSEGVQRLEGAARYNWQQQDLLRNSDGFGRSSSSHRGRRGRGRR